MTTLHLKKSIARCPWRLGLFLAALTVVWFGIPDNTQAVNPPPGGGYPGFTTAEGTKALFSLTTGSGNTAVGWYSLFSDTAGSFNTATGAGTLLFNTGDENTAIGTGALLSNTTGIRNTANGAYALLHNTEGGDNTANGTSALINNISGSSNTASGFAALDQNTTGLANTAAGFQALFSSTGGFNTAVGSSAFVNLASGDGNIGLGAGAGVAVTAASNVICIGSPGADVNNSCFIGHIRGVTTATSNAIPVLIDSAGQLGTLSSSQRYKTDIKPMDKASEAILALKPVSFRYKVHKDTTPQFGLIAEEVAEVNPDLVVRDENGEIYTVRYDAVNAMVLNEFLKEHRKVEELQTNVARQQKQIDSLTAGLQKVSAQLQATKPAPQVVNNP